MPWVLLRPWLRGLLDAGFEVHLACARGQHFDRLAGEGYVMRPVALKRSFNPLVHVLPFIQLVKLMRAGGFAVVNTHSPVAAAVGRLAAAFAGCPSVLYTVHGFYFHDDMPALPRKLLVGIEWLLGRLTNGFMFVSEEDHQTALRTGIVRRSADAITIHNGVDLAAFAPRETQAEAVRARKVEFGMPPGVPVIGIVGRIVKEKGFREFLAMAAALTRSGEDLRFLVMGDSLASDRDRFGAGFRAAVRDAGIEDRFVFTGFTERVREFLPVLDIFVLPTYREGLPRSIIEAMSAGLPVVSTKVRGAREVVVHGVTGLIVPPRDSDALTSAVRMLLADPELARRMGAAGRDRAVQAYDERVVRRRFVDFVERHTPTAQPRQPNRAAVLGPRVRLWQ